MNHTRTSIKDVALEAGVSIATVSHVINNTKPVSDELTLKVSKAIKKLNYHVTPVARSLKSGKTMTIGVIITNFNRVFFTQVLKGIQSEVKSQGYHLLLSDTNDSYETEKTFIDMLEAQWVDGIILDSSAPTDSEEYFDRLQKLGYSGKHIPVISIERSLTQYGIDSVSVDNLCGGRLATEHLLACGCQNIVHIKGPQYSQMVQERFLGYQDALKAAGLPLNPAFVLSGDFTPLSGYVETKKLLTTNPNFDGIFAANDQMAIGAMKACLECGRNIPDDIKMVGFDNTFVSSLVSPALTTLDVPKYQMGQNAVRLLMKRISNKQSPVIHETMPLNLIQRTSTSLSGDKNWDLLGW